METCSFCGKKTRRAITIRGLTLCEVCEARLITISAGSAAYEWFVRAVRRALLAG